MSEIRKYYSIRPGTVRLNRMLKRLIQQFKYGLKVTLQPTEHGPGSPERQIPFETLEYQSQHLAQAELLFSRSVRRKESLEEKAGKLIGILTFFAPIVIGAAGFSIDLGYAPTFQLFVVLPLFVIAFLSLTLSLVAAIRARRVTEVQGPGLDLFIDPDKDSMRPFDEKRTTACYLHCGQSNEVSNDQLADLVRASEAFLNLTLVTILLIGLVTVGFKSINVYENSLKDKPPQEVQLNNMEQLTSVLRSVEFSWQSGLSDLKTSIDTLVDALNRSRSDSAAKSKGSKTKRDSKVLQK